MQSAGAPSRGLRAGDRGLWRGPHHGQRPVLEAYLEHQWGLLTGVIDQADLVISSVQVVFSSLRARARQVWPVLRRESSQRHRVGCASSTHYVHLVGHRCGTPPLCVFTHPVVRDETGMSRFDEGLGHPRPMARSLLCQLPRRKHADRHFRPLRHLMSRARLGNGVCLLQLSHRDGAPLWWRGPGSDQTGMTGYLGSSA